MLDRAARRVSRPAVTCSWLALLAAGSFLGLAAPARAEDPRFVVRYDDARSTVESERLLDNLERAFSEVLEARPESASLREVAERLVAVRETHAAQEAEFEDARLALEQAKARLERDERLVRERRAGEAWNRLTPAERSALASREAEYLGRIRAATANREAQAQTREASLAGTREVLAAYGGSWGSLALERAVVEPGRILRLSGSSWHRAMAQHGERFVAYVNSRHAGSPCVLAAAQRPLLSHRIPAGALATGVREPGPAAPTLQPGFQAPTPVRPTPAQPTPTQPYGAHGLGERAPGTPGAVVGGSAPHGDSPRTAAGGEFEPVFPASPGKPVLPPGAAPTTAPRTEMHGGFLWYLDWDDAAAEARRTGRLIYCLSTKPDCHMCEAVRDESVAAHAADMSRLCVGFVYNIFNPEKDPRVARVDGLLRRNLVGYSMMPLTGWVTPDLTWVHGFHGWRTPDNFRSELARARSTTR